MVLKAVCLSAVYELSYRIYTDTVLYSAQGSCFFHIFCRYVSTVESYHCHLGTTDNTVHQAWLLLIWVIVSIFLSSGPMKTLGVSRHSWQCNSLVFMVKWSRCVLQKQTSAELFILWLGNLFVLTCCLMSSTDDGNDDNVCWFDRSC